MLLVLKTAKAEPAESQKRRISLMISLLESGSYETSRELCKKLYSQKIIFYIKKVVISYVRVYPNKRELPDCGTTTRYDNDRMRHRAKCSYCLSEEWLDSNCNIFNYTAHNIQKKVFS